MAEAAKGAAAGGAEAVEQEKSLLDSIIDKAKPSNDKEGSRIKGFVSTLIEEALKAPGSVVSGDLERTIKLWQAEIDRKLSKQVNEILHNPDFQKLEGTWRGLDYLVKNSETSDALKIKVLNASKKVMAKSLENAVEFDQSTLFKQIYESEYGVLGGQPYGLMVGDYEFDNSPDDVGMLGKIAGVAAAAHAPFVSAASAQMLGMTDYSGLNDPRDLEKIFASEDYIAWKSFRNSPDSRYVALTMPRVLSRLPYGRATKPIDEFNFEEEVDRDHNKYLWMNAAWAYAARTTAAYANDGWFMRTRGVESGGKVEGLPVHVFEEDGGKTMKCPTEVLIPDRRENELSKLGFLPLLHCKNTDFAAFLGAQSAQNPEKYFDPSAQANANLSTNFSYMLCVSRFAHYLKVMARDRIGAMMEADDMKRWLNDWINNYVLATPEVAGPENKAKSPLREAKIEVTEVKGKPGWYQAVAHLRPHFQLEGLGASMRLVAEVPKGNN